MTRALKPQSNGELIDAALRTLRRQFVPLFSVLLMFELVAHAAWKACELFLYAHLTELKDFIAHPDPDHLAADPQAAALALAAMAGFFFVSFMLWQMSIGSLTLPPGTPWAPPAVSPLAALRRLGPRLGALLITLSLEALLLGLALLSGAVPFCAGVLAVLAMQNLAGVALLGLGTFGGFIVAIGALLMVLLRYALVPQIVVAEGLSGRAALGRSAALMRGKPGQRLWDLPKIRGSILILIVQLLTQAVVFVISTPQALVSVGSHALGATPGAILTVLAEALALVGETAAVPFGVLVLVGFYFDLRVRREGLDLELIAAELAATR